jgi:hypothetical protein
MRWSDIRSIYAGEQNCLDVYVRKAGVVLKRLLFEPDV